MESILTSGTFKALLLYVVTLIADAVGKKYGYGLNAESIAGLTASVVAFIAGRQYKTTKIETEKIAAEAAKAPVVTTPAASPAAALAEAGK